VRGRNGVRGTFAGARRDSPGSDDRAVGGCDREPHVLEALLDGRPVEAFDGELRAHVDGCEPCRELAMVASLVQADARAARDEAAPPTASVVWWRAQRRARREAERLADRPVRVAQAVAAACLAGLAAGFAWSAWAWLARWGSWLAALVPDLPVETAGADRLGTWPAVLAALGGLVVLATVAVCVAVLRDEDR
jgi:hypothetical protein